MQGAHHIGLTVDHLRGNGALGRYVLLPGDRSRAERIAARLEEVRVVRSPRGLDAHLGVLRGERGAVDVLAISSGMGTPSVEIVGCELLELGARRIVRVGSCASMHDDVLPGGVVVVTGAVRDEGTSDRWTPTEFPAFAHPEAVGAMCRGARALGLSDRTWAGICHSKDSLFAREFFAGPRGEANRGYVESLRAAGVIATEMEASLLFVLAAVHSAGKAASLAEGSAGVPVQAACVLGVYGEMGTEVTKRADAAAIDVACAGVLAWAEADGVGPSGG